MVELDAQMDSWPLFYGMGTAAVAFEPRNICFKGSSCVWFPLNKVQIMQVLLLLNCTN